MPRTSAKVSRDYTTEFLTNEIYKDRWIHISVPSAKGEIGKPSLKGKHLKGFILGDDIRDSLSMNMGAKEVGDLSNSVGGALDSLTGVLGESGAGGNLASKFTGSASKFVGGASKVVDDFITYDGSNNATYPFDFVVQPEVGGNMSMKEIIAFLNRLIRPKPYNVGISMSGLVSHTSYIEELTALSALATAFEEAGSAAVGVIKNLTSTDSEKTKEAEVSSWSDGYIHVKVGDNIKMTGMVATDISPTYTVLRDDDGQFYGVQVSMSFAPYRLPDAEVSIDFLTNKSSWEII